MECIMFSDDCPQRDNARTVACRVFVDCSKHSPSLIFTFRITPPENATIKDHDFSIVFFLFPYTDLSRATSEHTNLYTMLASRIIRDPYSGYVPHPLHTNIASDVSADAAIAPRNTSSTYPPLPCLGSFRPPPRILHTSVPKVLILTQY